MRSLLAVLAMAALCSCAKKAYTEESEWQTFTATAYSVEGTTASGKKTVEGRTVAADPAILPKGTRIQVADAGPYDGDYIVQDTGLKIKGREIDIFIDNPVEARKFGKQPVRVKVLARGQEK